MILFGGNLWQIGCSFWRENEDAQPMGSTDRATHLTSSILAVRWELQLSPRKFQFRCTGWLLQRNLITPPFSASRAASRSFASSSATMNEFIFRNEVDFSVPAFVRIFFYCFRQKDSVFPFPLSQQLLPVQQLGDYLDQPQSMLTKQR